MRVTKFISEDHIEPDLQATTRAGAIEELIDRLFRDRSRLLAQTALERVRAREEVASTGIGGGIALPHAPTPGVSELTCAVGRSGTGIDFRSVDGEPVHLVFLICYPPDQQSSYLYFVAALGQILREAGLVEALRRASTAADLLSALDVQEPCVPRADEDVASAEAPVHRSEILLLARLELLSDQLASTRTGRETLQRRIETLEALLQPSLVRRFEQLRRSGHRAVATVEGGVCQGCFKTLPSALVQELRAEGPHPHTCPGCQRFLYPV